MPKLVTKMKEQLILQELKELDLSKLIKLTTYISKACTCKGVDQTSKDELAVILAENLKRHFITEVSTRDLLFIME